jgi:hypothetical protein
MVGAQEPRIRGAQEPGLPTRSVADSAWRLNMVGAQEPRIRGPGEAIRGEAHRCARGALLETNVKGL